MLEIKPSLLPQETGCPGFAVPGCPGFAVPRMNKQPHAVPCSSFFVYLSPGCELQLFLIWDLSWLEAWLWGLLLDGAAAVSIHLESCSSLY